MERDDAVNFSTLKYLRFSPLAYRYALAHPREDTEALLLGRVTHCAVYEPQELDSRYVLSPRFHGGMKDANAIAKGYDGGKEAKAAWIEAAGDRTVVPPEIWQRALDAATAVTTDPVAGPMVEGGFSEQTIKWTDKRTGIECRGRVDHVNGSLSDLKTTRAPGPRAFMNDAARYNYHVQLAFYADGLRANGIDIGDEPALVAVESLPPHDVVVYQIDEETLEAGRATYRDWLDALVSCRKRDDWPGAADRKPVKFTLPAWAQPQLAEELTMGGERVF